jgi:hypothetical protein
MIPSILNDVIGPVMRGPSSSHCAAALRIGRLARDLMDGSFDDVLVEFDRRGSLTPTTHETQGSDIDGTCGQIDTNTWRGSHVALRDPKTGDWSVAVVTGEKRTIQLSIAPGLKTGPVHVWKSTEAAQFIQQPPLSLHGNSIELELEPDAIYTFNSTTGQQKGSHGTPPARKPFPFPFVDGKKPATVTDKSRAKGMAFPASTYDRNLFDNVRVGPLPAKVQAK